MDRVATRITRTVGTMWCAVAFSALALVSLPAAIGTHDVVVIVAWVAQTFLQLVLLSVIMVGQRLEAARTEARDQETHDTVLAEHAETRAILLAVQAVLNDVHTHTRATAAQ